MTSVFLCDARGDAIREQHHLRALLWRRVDGLIVVGARPDVRSSLGQNLGVPVVYAYAPSDDPDDLSLVTDHYGGGELAIDHLLTCGRRRIGHISGDPSYGAAQDRARGALARLERAGLELAGGQVFFGAWSEAWGRNATRELVRRAPNIDAIFAGSDQIARGVLDTLDRAGVAVPSQVSVVGFDNWEALATNSRPPVDQHRHEPAAAGSHRRPTAVLGYRWTAEVGCRNLAVPRGRPGVFLTSRLACSSVFTETRGGYQRRPVGRHLAQATMVRAVL